MLNGIVSRLRKQEVRLWRGSVEKPAETQQAQCCSPVTSYKDDISMSSPPQLPNPHPPHPSVSVPVALSSDGKKEGKKPAIRGHNEFKSAALREGKPAIV